MLDSKGQNRRRLSAGNLGDAPALLVQEGAGAFPLGRESRRGCEGGGKDEAPASAEGHRVLYIGE
jgi:hypothetical protein